MERELITHLFDRNLKFIKILHHHTSLQGSANHCTVREKLVVVQKQFITITLSYTLDSNTVYVRHAFHLAFDFYYFDLKLKVSLPRWGLTIDLNHWS